MGVLKLEQVISIGLQVEDTSYNVRVGEWYRLVATASPTDWKYEFKRFVNNWSFADDVDEPTASELVELDVNDVDVHEFGASLERSDTNVDLLKAVGRQHERIAWLNLHFERVRGETLDQA